jgi:hypothetical protein
MGHGVVGAVGWPRYIQHYATRLDYGKQDWCAERGCASQSWKALVESLVLEWAFLAKLRPPAPEERSAGN